MLFALMNKYILFISLASTPEDYTPLPVEIMFPAGTMEREPVCILVNIVDDDVPERTEFFSVTLESDNVDVDFEESRSILTVTIEDNDGMKTITYTLNLSNIA